MKLKTIITTISLAITAVISLFTVGLTQASLYRFHVDAHIADNLMRTDKNELIKIHGSTCHVMNNYYGKVAFDIKNRVLHPFKKNNVDTTRACSVEYIISPMKLSPRTYSVGKLTKDNQMSNLYHDAKSGTVLEIGSCDFIGRNEEQETKNSQSQRRELVVLNANNMVMQVYNSKEYLVGKCQVQTIYSDVNFN